VVRVNVRFPSFVFKTLAGRVGGWVGLTREVTDGTTVAGLLSDLVETYPGFRERVFSPDTGTVNEQIGVVLNDRLLAFAELSQIGLSNDDKVVIQPVYSGG